MALIFAAREAPICEVTIFFHGRLLRACRSQKVNAGALHAFDSPNMPPLATTGITINENSHLILPPARGVLRVHTRMDTRLLALRPVPGFDDQILRHTIEAGAESGSLRALVLQLYGTGNAPAAKKDLIECLKRATDLGILVIASTQCHKGSVMMGHYATGEATSSFCS
jgi:L-asparaginase